MDLTVNQASLQVVDPWCSCGWTGANPGRQVPRSCGESSLKSGGYCSSIVNGLWNTSSSNVQRVFRCSLYTFWPWSALTVRARKEIHVHPCLTQPGTFIEIELKFWHWKLILEIKFWTLNTMTFNRISWSVWQQFRKSHTVLIYLHLLAKSVFLTLLLLRFNLM